MVELALNGEACKATSSFTASSAAGRPLPSHTPSPRAHAATLCQTTIPRVTLLSSEISEQRRMMACAPCATRLAMMHAATDTTDDFRAGTLVSEVQTIAFSFLAKSLAELGYRRLTRNIDFDKYWHSGPYQATVLCKSRCCRSATHCGTCAAPARTKTCAQRPIPAVSKQSP